ncbi:F-box/FBD/LRR-repeat protein At5g18770 isoform X2 [Lathyrus oleraceus]|uniref:F-box/FBD/LRR-repeat protein At5g18770 isoform X2 n=1 Tax=Pisum sativum TaxID=3888 RepID=UPI0021CEFF39|nr:F-box/FBD/LRR-repeat protein At5g18770-like isoform X2 [Pisum sativum]
MAWIQTNMGRRRVDGDQHKDRLSDLPECIILHILSFLRTPHAVQTCVLSTRWKHLWKRIPTLNLNSFQFRTLKIFSVFMSKVLSLRDPSTALHTFNISRRGDIEPRLLKKFLNYVYFHNIHLQELVISLHGDIGLIFSCVSSCRALTSLKLSVGPTWRDPKKTLFPKSLNLPLLTSLDLEDFAFCGDESGCAEPFLEFTKLNSLVIRSCKLYAPSLCAFNYAGSHHIHNIRGSGLSSIKQVNIESVHFSASQEDALVLFSWLLDFANIESLTVTSTALQILSLVPDLFEVKLRSLHKLKSLKIDLIRIYEGSLLVLMKEAMLKKAAAKSPKEGAKLRKAFETCFEPPAIPDGMVDFLRQNSPSAEVNLTTKYPSSFNLKQIGESIKGVKINNYRSRFSMRSSSSLPRLSVRSSSSSVASAAAAKSASDAAPASAAEPASAASPNLDPCLGEKDVKSSNKDDEEKHQHNTNAPLQDNGQ